MEPARPVPRATNVGALPDTRERIARRTMVHRVPRIRVRTVALAWRTPAKAFPAERSLLTKDERNY